MIRFDPKALFSALDEEREKRGLTWSQAAAEIGVAEATIKRTKSGGRMEVNGMLAMVNWLRVPVETFIRKTAR